MLFYDKNDNVCLKINSSKYKVLYDGDVFVLNNKYYTYNTNYFIPTDIIDGDLYKNYDKKIHHRHMDIKEINEVGF